MQVGDILRKKAARVATVRMNETVAIAAQLMRSGNISALVVKDVVRTEGNTAVGMFTERDVVRAIAELGRDARYVASVDDIVAQLARELKEGDRVVILSNGGFGGIHEKLLDRLSARV